MAEGSPRPTPEVAPPRVAFADFFQIQDRRVCAGALALRSVPPSTDYFLPRAMLRALLTHPPPPLLLTPQVRVKSSAPTLDSPPRDTPHGFSSIYMTGKEL